MEVYSFVFSPIGVNTYVLADKSGKCAVIDCACYYKEEFDRLVSFIDEHNLEPVMLINTHCHLDHVFGAKRFFEKYGISYRCHRDEVYNAQHAVKEAESFNLTMEEPPMPEMYLVDGNEISFGSTTLKVLFVPGHSAGSLAFYSEKDGVVFTGDSLFEGTIGRTDLYGGNYKQLISSIRSQLFALPPETIICPGHGGESTIGVEMESNPYFNQI